MGNCGCKVKDIDENIDNEYKLKLDDFALLYPKGRGGFDHVWKVRLKRQYIVKNLDIGLLKINRVYLPWKKWVKQKYV